MMYLVGLKGFSSFGRIDEYFYDGWFPTKFNWSPWDLKTVEDGYTEYLQSLDPEGLTDPSYLLIAYSDGGTVAHQLAMCDKRCKGLIAHSAVFADRYVKEYLELMEQKPILLLYNKDDRTGMDTSTKRAQKFYASHGNIPTMIELKCDTFLRHGFANGLDMMSIWTKQHLNFHLPVKHATTTES